MTNHRRSQQRMTNKRSKTVKILYLEDNKLSVQLVEAILNELMPAYEMKIIKTKKELLKISIQFKPDIILSSYQPEKYSISETHELLLTENHRISHIIITEILSEEISNELVRKRVEAYVFKSNLTQLPFSIMNAIEKNKVIHDGVNTVKVVRRLLSVNKDLIL